MRVVYLMKVILSTSIVKVFGCQAIKVIYPKFGDHITNITFLFI